MNLESVCYSVQSMIHNLNASEDEQRLIDEEAACIGLKILQELNCKFGKIPESELAVTYPVIYLLFNSVGYKCD